MYYCFVVNGRDDKAALSNLIEALIKAVQQPIQYEVYTTKFAGDATYFVRNFKAETDTCFVACGGDGTVNEVASGMVGDPRKYLAVLAMGTGNDFVKYYPDHDFNSIQALVSGNPTKLDIMKIGDRYSINVTNFGFDSIVGSIGAKLSAKGVKNPFRWGIAVALLKGRYNKIKVFANGEQLNYNGKLLLCTVSNGHYVGGEFYCAPKAKNNDGLKDVCLIKTMSLFRFLSLLPTYRSGQHLDSTEMEKDVEYVQTDHVEIVAQNQIELCLDGEMLAGKEFAIDILSKAVNFIIPGF